MSAASKTASCTSSPTSLARVQGAVTLLRMLCLRGPPPVAVEPTLFKLFTVHSSGDGQLRGSIRWLAAHGRARHVACRRCGRAHRDGKARGVQALTQASMLEALRGRASERHRTDSRQRPTPPAHHLLPSYTSLRNPPSWPPLLSLCCGRPLARRCRLHF